VRSEQASAGGAAFAGGVAAPAMKMAAITAPRLIFEAMSQGSYAEWRRLFYCRVLAKQADISDSITKTGKEARVVSPVKR
jgi:hypothetical protein